MINFKRFFSANKRAIVVSKAQKEILECFLINKAAFDHWFSLQPETKIRFKFYYPTAIDFFFDDCKLFTAYFKKNAQDGIELQELKMSEENRRSISSSVWKPFEEVMLQFLTNLDENQKVDLFQKRRALYEYADICKSSPATAEAYPMLKEQLQ